MDDLVMGLSFGTRFKLKVAAWHLVILGIVLNILSALLTNGMIDQHNQKIANIELLAEQQNQKINELWAQVQHSERKRELFLQLYASESNSADNDQSGLSDLPKALKNYLADTLRNYHNQPVIGWQLNKVMAIFDRYQQSLRDQIDLVWEMRDNKAQLPAIYQEVSRLRSLALFLQLLGLILILSRDLSHGLSRAKQEL